MGSSPLQANSVNEIRNSNMLPGEKKSYGKISDKIKNLKEYKLTCQKIRLNLIKIKYMNYDIKKI